MYGFWLSLGLVFLAELGDKTQLVALMLATRFKAGIVLAGVFVATLLVHAFSVLLGGISRQASASWLGLVALGPGLYRLCRLDLAR